MKWLNSKNIEQKVTLEQAVFNSLPPEKDSLYIPETLPKIVNSNNVRGLQNLNYQELSYKILTHFIDEDEIPPAILKLIVDEALNFQLPILPVKRSIAVLELFHGPSLSFKDFGARLMASIMSYFLTKQDKKLKIIVATSGDTGSAVAESFHSMPNIDVFVLYPKNKISLFQEKQITTLGENIHAISINGNFDDCQKLLKQSLSDDDLNKKHYITTCNSINIGRLLAQITYYAYVSLKYENKPNIVVPSGNLGNLTAGIYAKHLGFPIDKFIAATNSNDTFTRYLETGELNPRETIPTISNAMDVSRPSNLERIRSLYKDDINLMKNDLKSISVTQEQTLETIKNTFELYKKIICPHTAVALYAANYYQEKSIEAAQAEGKKDRTQYLVLATAHPSKFQDVIEPLIPNAKFDSVESFLAIPNSSTSLELENDYASLKNIIEKNK